MNAELNRSDTLTVATLSPESGTPESRDVHPYVRHVNPHLADLLAKLRLDKRFIRGEGCELFDTAGRRYLDCVAAYGALPFGYNPPAIWRALKALRVRGEPSFVQPSLLDAAGELATRLVELAPAGLCRVTFANSGAEAVEAAIKLCRAATKRLGILSTHGSFHGKTLGALSATGNPEYQRGFGAPAEGFDQIPYGDVEALRQSLADRPGYYATLIVEPIQGEGGIVEPPPGYLAAVHTICKEAGVLLALDEIQTGLGRTGDLFACEAEGVVPDVLLLAKALGGGLIPIGAVLCTEDAYTTAFAMKHSSTFAGNALACRAGLATLERITRDEGRLLTNVARNGRFLRRRLEELAARYPHLIAEVRGRGYMLGIRFGVGRDLWPQCLLGMAAEQGFFTPIFASYMLNVEGVRVAPTLNGNSVIRIEPPLTFRRRDCETLLKAFERALEAFSQGDSGRILKAILEGEPQAPGISTRHATQRPAVVAKPGETRFAFLLHPLDDENYTDFDPSLGVLGREDLARVSRDFSSLIDPFVLSRARVTTRTGQSIYGEFISLAWTAAQMAAMPRQQAAAGVRAALELARSRGAQIVGLGAFTSVVTRGGLDVSREGVPVTTGNSYTAVASAQAVAMAMKGLGLGFGPHIGAAIVGGSGAIGRAMAQLLAEDVGRLVLIGNPDRAFSVTRRRLLTVAADVCRHLAVRHGEGYRFAHGSIGSRLLAAHGGCLEPDAPTDQFITLAERLEGSGAFLLTNLIDEVLPMADVVVTATSATGTLISPRALRPGALVCDLSRPANVSAEVAAARPDVLVIDGGIIDVPGHPDLGLYGLGHGLAYACMAETMMLSLEGHLRNTSLGTDLAPEGLRMLHALADRHGFHVAQLRSFGQPLNDDDWNRLLAARAQRSSAGAARVPDVKLRSSRREKSTMIFQRQAQWFVGSTDKRRTVGDGHRPRPPPHPMPAPATHAIDWGMRQPESKPGFTVHEGERPMVRIAATEERVLTVQASPESVYAFFSKPEQLSQAMASVERCELLPDNKVRWLLEEKVDKGIRFRADYTVAYSGDGSEHVLWRSVEGNMRNDGDVWIKPLACGGTEIRYRESVEPELPITPLLATLIKPLVARELRGEINAFLERVQDQFAGVSDEVTERCRNN